MSTVKLHSGMVTVESEVGKGSVFTVYLPIVEGSASEERDRGAAAAGPAGVSVLVVDDEELVRNMVGKMLERGGYKVVFEADGAAAIERYRSSWREFDLVLLDINLPRVNGRDAYLAMRQINAGVKVLFFSGFGLTADLDDLLVPGKAEFLSKPFRQAEMFDRVLSLLGRRP